MPHLDQLMLDNQRLTQALHEMSMIAYNQAMVLDALVKAHDVNNYALIKTRLQMMSRYRATIFNEME